LGKEDYFYKEKNFTTRVKHLLFEETLKTSLGTANNILQRGTWQKAPKIYGYLDLYAGEGLFLPPSSEGYTKDNYGTPLLALESFKSLKGNKNKVVYQKLKIIACEIDDYRRKRLKEILMPKGKEISQLLEIPVEVLILSSWNHPKNKEIIIRELKGVPFGFIFADPFNVELPLDEFEELLRTLPKYWDILIFVNIGHIQRFVNRSNSDRQRIARFLSVSPEELIQLFRDFSDEENHKENHSDIVITRTLSIIRNKLKAIRENSVFVVSVALPLSYSSGKVIKRDYYGLVLASGMPSVIEAFLKGYIKILENHTSLPNLFPRLEPEIKNILKKAERLSLWDLMDLLYAKWFSWKDIVKNGYLKDLPTIDNLIDKINELLENGDIEIKAPEDVLYKRKKGINKNMVKRRQKYLKEIWISLKR